MNRRSSPRTLTIRVWLVDCVRIHLQRRTVDAAAEQGLGGEPAEDVVADPGADRRADPQPGEVNGRVGRPAADVQDQVVDGDQLARAGQVIERRGDVIGDDQPGADDRRRGLDC